MLDSAITDKRKQMVEMGMKKGFTHPETVHVSQELDKLLNLWMHHERKDDSSFSPLSV